MNNLAKYPALGWLIFLLPLILVAVRSALIPFAHDEVATFYFYIQPGEFLPFASHVDANGHFLTSALGWLCFEISGSSPFSLRFPSLAAFILLCYAVARFRERFASTAAYFGFAASLLGVFTFVAFFSLCRGYGISMACFVLALYYLYTFAYDKKPRHHVKFVVLIQLALAANLTLIFAAAFCTLVAVLFQIRHRLPFTPRLLAMYLLHAALIVFWISYAFYLRSHGALYYGAGESYWQVTFVSLIETLFGKSPVVIPAVILLFFVAGIICVRNFLADARGCLHHQACLSFLLLTGLVATFFVLKKVAGVNYPEDRTGLFFYPLFVIVVFGAADTLRRDVLKKIFLFPAAGAVVCAAGFFNLYNHPFPIYETIPRGFYDILVDEQKSSSRPVTVAGHRVREFLYGFMNYRSGTKLSHMTSPEALQMNCDYAVAVKADEPWYGEYYSELAAEDRWGFRLLKRKEQIVREPMWQQQRSVIFEGNAEYFNCLEFRDTIFNNDRPFQAEVTFRVEKAPKPFRAWFVLQVDGPAEEDGIFVRSPLDLIAYDWCGQEQSTLCLTTGATPKNVKRLVMYLWNIDQAPVKMQIDSCKLTRLNASGINFTSKAAL